MSVHVPLKGRIAALDQREQDFGLVRKRSLEEAVADADAIVVVGRGSGATANGSLLEHALEHAPAGSACFVHGVLSDSLKGASQTMELAYSRDVSLLVGTPTAVTWRLPEVDLPAGTPLREALIVVQGASPQAEINGLEGLLPVIERRRGGESGVRAIRLFQGEDLWQAGAEGLWSWPLLAAAVSRSNTPQGDPVRDGRSQDLVGLGLAPKLARHPRGVMIDHRDGLRSAILVLDGVVADYNFAVQARDGSMVSAQLYRPPPPGEHHYDRLAAVMEDFFRTRKAPWPLDRNLLIAGLLEAVGKPAARAGRLMETPELTVSYNWK